MHLPFWIAAPLTACFLAGPAQGAEAPEYLGEVKPLLKAKCYACHGALKQEGGLRLDTAKSAIEGGDSGAAITPGDAAASLLIERVTLDDESLRMPQQGAPLSAKEVALLKSWIDAGAAAPEQEAPEDDPREHWAFRPPVRPAIPEIPGAEIRNPIDAFLEAKRREQGPTAQPPVERSLLLRRVYLDLIGLPPTPAELHAFLDDDSPDAYERVVLRLLDSPQHGERWARHWMDVWRYSDWYGRRTVPDVWNSAPQIWRWRDWIVRSLNEDRGYNRMVREMLAADEIAPEDYDAGVATGYLVRNWYALNPNDWMRNNVEHTGKAFLGLTFNCAHCHDHKYDPITQDDYFRLRAFFEPIGVRQDRVPGEADPGPFQEYDYSVLRKVVRLGAVRIFDKAPEAPTWFYTGGDERNRVTERGAIAPGVPAFLGPAPKIKPVELPPRAWYPGLRPGIQETALQERRDAIAAAEAELSSAKRDAEAALPPLRAKLGEAQSAFDAALEVAKKDGRDGALAGRQSLLLDATAGRRVLYQPLSQLAALDEGATLSFEVKLLADAHFNFQLTRDIEKGLTAGYVGFDGGRILSYQPGSFTEFEAGRYDFAAGQNRFEVSLVFDAGDACRLTVRSLSDGQALVDAAPIARNGWSPIGNPQMPILFDARPGSRVLIDNVQIIGGAEDAAAPLVRFDFEPPVYVDGRDVVGIEGWSASALGQAPGRSAVSMTAGNQQLAEVTQALRIARCAVEAQELLVASAEAKEEAARAAFAAVEARIAADRARYGESSGDAEALAKTAARLEFGAAVKSSGAQVTLAKQKLRATEAAKASSDDERVKTIEAAAKQLADARSALEKTQASATDAATASYPPLSPTYPETSTGRRRALAEWIAGDKNPLTARVAVNHLWMRHFHEPLVATVNDFGRNGAAPTHPELLDWLAVEFMESGWSMKRLHYQIVTSDAYRMSCRVGQATAQSHAPQNAQIDPDNKYHWRMNVGRMEAETVRDSLLSLAGRLNLTLGGQELENSEALTTRRRSLYYSCHPELDGKSELGALFDAPDADGCYRRTRTIVPQQALALTNSQLVHDVSADVAKAVDNDAAAELGESQTRGFIVAGYERILCRDPSPAEIELCEDFLARQTELLAETDSAGAAAKAREGLIRVLLNHNDFLAIR